MKEKFEKVMSLTKQFFKNIMVYGIVIISVIASFIVGYTYRKLTTKVIEPKTEKKRLTKADKEIAMQSLGTEIKGLKADLFVETRKGKRAEITRRLSKANRELKKLM